MVWMWMRAWAWADKLPHPQKENRVLILKRKILWTVSSSLCDT